MSAAAFIESFGGILSEVVVLLFLSTITVVLRVIARYKQKTAFGADDFLIIPAWFSFIGMSIIGFYGISLLLLAMSSMSNSQGIAKGTLGSPQGSEVNIDPSEDALVSIDILIWPTYLLSTFGMGFTRISALLFYRRIFVDNSRKQSAFGIATFTSIIIVLSWTVSFLVTQILGYGPTTEWPDPLVIFDDGDPNWNISLVVTSSALDILVLVLPFPKIWMLQLRSTQKLVISTIFLVAIIGVTASLVRLAISIDIYILNISLALDQTYYEQSSEMYYSAVLEAGLGLIAVNLPSLRPLFKGVSPKDVRSRIQSWIRRARMRFSATKNPALILGAAEADLLKAPGQTRVTITYDIELACSMPTGNELTIPGSFARSTTISHHRPDLSRSNSDIGSMLAPRIRPDLSRSNLDIEITFPPDAWLDLSRSKSDVEITPAPRVQPNPTPLNEASVR